MALKSEVLIVTTKGNIVIPNTWWYYPIVGGKKVWRIPSFKTFAIAKIIDSKFLPPNFT